MPYESKKHKKMVELRNSGCRETTRVRLRADEEKLTRDSAELVRPEVGLIE